ncbi:TetR family transcriptional regulator [Burkholderia humptydooensis]|uniref:TetR family transcriptional regulator n=3 Tax=Burkholderia humptydooensis TaxID=430531 RepID=A0A7T2WZC0_9BURK|nr:MULTISPECIES: TetR/AcrR family transcriptional regulator [Burkholderia]AJY41820.1 bacterial regulatory s, tetR family protein [Burkholderia sp. 2002721687]QPS44920.1 TetR family transcriptional regulator [Burkholderia humptydooensis]
MKQDKREQLKAKKQAYVQDEILSSAVSLFAERGFRAVTIDDIASNLGYTKSVVYYYFKSKNEILWQIFTRIYDTYFEMISSISATDLSPEDALRKIIIGHAMNVMERREWTAIYFREESELDEKQRKLMLNRKREYDATIEKVYRAGVEAGTFQDIPPHVAVTGILGMCNWLYTWYSDKGPMSSTEIAEYYVSMLTKGYLVEAKERSGTRKGSAKPLKAAVA